MKKLLTLGCFLFVLLSACQKQELQPDPKQAESKNLSKTHDKAPTENGKTVRILYIIPADRSFNRTYNNAIKKAAGIIDRWYRSEMDGLSYLTDNPVVEVFQSDKPAAWFGADNGGISGTDPFFYFFWNTFTEMESLLGAGWYSPGATAYMVYVDAFGQTGAGFTGFCALPEHDLLGIAGEDNNPPIQWTGGQAHELGHAFGLPHPDQTHPSYNETLMGFGYASFPKTFLLDSDKEILLASGFFK